LTKFHVETSFIEDGYDYRSLQHRNKLYIYVYKRGYLRYDTILALKVVVVNE
jgi:hypothetical protein